jgi:putative FmdB family regulatory protein
LPTYEYACTACGHRLEAVQSFTDDPLSQCPDCGGALRKVYGAVGIVLKGSGFYKTDSRTASGASSNGKKGGGAENQSSDTSTSDSSSKKDASADKDKGGSGSSDSEKSSSSKDSAPASSTAS